MIAELHGTISRRHDGWLVLDVGGVGYRVEVSARTMAALPSDGAQTRLLIESYIREDQFRLFGFASQEEQHWFSLMLSVPGVGAKLALAIQGHFAPAALQTMLAQGQAEELAQAPGVGKKLAARLVQELKDKVPRPEPALAASADGAASAAEQDVLLALRKLGYQPSEAQRALAAGRRAAQTAANKNETEVAAANEKAHADDDKDNQKTPAASVLLRRALQELAR